ncbi:cannabinoid receptor type 1B-like [Oryzias latipes]|uniref:cannabinoid receptor type 1B-like n=1 Tax=Oryzias latipes TaxID=8090 RepID=UPI0002A4CA4B|nr:cannabinoid receptor type 1B-like [Oryzias latipes]
MPLSVSSARRTVKVAVPRVTQATMSTLATGVRYLGSNDASYDDPSADSGLVKNGLRFGKHPSLSSSFPEIFPESKEVFYAAVSPIFPMNVSDVGNVTSVEIGGAHQCSENFADNLECFMILTPGQQLAIAILALTLGTFTVLENLVVLCVILHSQTLRSRPSYHFIGSLAVADLIGSIIFVYSFLDFHVLHRKDSPNIFLFKLAGVIASFTASVGSLFLTAIDRYISIHRPMAYKRIVTKTKAVTAFSMMWTISIVISLLPLLGWNCKNLGTVCSDIFPLIDQKYLMFWIGVTSILVLFIIYAYMFILWKSHHHAVRMLSRSSQRSVIVQTPEGSKVQMVRPDQARMDLRLAKTLVLILVALIICWGPLLVIMVYDLFGKVNDSIKTVFAFCSMLCLLNSTVNPIIYAMRSKDLRRALLNICHLWRGTSSSLDSSAESDWNTRSLRASAVRVGKAGRGGRETNIKVERATVSGATETSAAEPV